MRVAIMKENNAPSNWNGYYSEYSHESGKKAAKKP